MSQASAGLGLVTRAAFAFGLVDGIVDLTATGTTLAENDLEAVEQIVTCTARLIANPVAHKLKAAAIDALVEKVRAR